jgi:ketosteroid isomerase-like protein
MKLEDRLFIEAQCRRLIQSFFVLSDRGEAEAYANLYTQDGSFTRPGLSVCGHNEIGAAIRARPPHLAFRHLGITALVEVIDEHSATGRGSHMLVMHDRNTGEVSPPVVGDFEDIYLKTAEGWRIAKRIVRAIA